MFKHRDITDITEPFWRGSAEDFLKSLDFEQLKKLTPQEVINLARTQEELFALREFLQENYGSGSMWDKYYHKRREELGLLPSYDRRKNVFYAPLEPKRVLKPGGDPTNRTHYNINRNLSPSGLSMAQITGKQDAFDIINDNKLGPTLKRDPIGVYRGSAATKRVVTFDIETTGIKPEKGHQVVSLGYSVDGKKTRTIFGEFPKKRFENFIENVIRPQWESGVKASGGRVVSEKEIIKDFIKEINTDGTTLRGFNIKRFDVPFLYESAKRHGLGEQFKMAMGKVRIDDVVERAKHFLTERVGGQYIGFSKLSADHGLSSVGYKLEALAAGFGYSPAGGAHAAAQDVQMTDFLSEILSDPTRRNTWSTSRWANKVEELTGTKPLRVTSEMRRLDFSKHIIADEAFYARPFMEHASIKHPETVKGPFRYAPLEEVLSPKKTAVPKPIGEFGPNRTLDFLNRTRDKTVSTAATKRGLKTALGAGGLFAGILAAGAASRSLFSDYGFREGGAISENRLDQLFGFSAPETSEEFFKREEDEQTEGFKGQLAGQQMGKTPPSLGGNTDTKFRPGELKPLSSTTAEVDLTKFSYEFVDADTVRLTPKNFLSRIGGRDPISIRLSGLDAPETAHGDIGAMPQAQAATARANNLIRGKSLRIIVSTDPSSKTHGRYVGLAYSADSSKPINLRLVEEGLAAAMTYDEGLLNEKQYKDAERKAIKDNLGIWQLDYYKQYKKERDDHRGRLGFNVLIGAAEPEIQERRLRVKSSLFRRDEHLQVEGLDHYNIAQHVRHINTDFGSSWDIVRSIAKGMYKALDPEDAYQTLLRNPAFKESIRTAASSGGTKLGAGLTADVTTHKAVFKHGLADLPEEFDFAVKQYSTAGLNQQAAEDAFSRMAPGIREALSDPESHKAWLAKANAINEPHSLEVVAASLQREQEALKKLGGLNAPSLYGSGAEYGLDKNAIIMERFKGEVIGNVPLSRVETSDLYGFVKESHKRGVSHTDLHAENIMRVQTPEGPRMGVLDYGMSNRLEKGASTTYQSEIKDLVESAAAEFGIGDVGAKKFQEVIDINRVYAHALRGEASRGAGIASERIAGIEGSFSELIQNTQSRDMSKIKESLIIVKDMLKTTDEAADFFGATKPFNIIDDAAKRQTSLISSADKTAVSLGTVIPGHDDAYNSLEGLHPNSVYGAGSLILKKTTDFGSGSKRGMSSWLSIQEEMQKGASAFDAIKHTAEKFDTKVFTKKEEFFKHIEDRLVPLFREEGMSEKGLSAGKEKLKHLLGLSERSLFQRIKETVGKTKGKILGVPTENYMHLASLGREAAIFTDKSFLVSTHELTESREQKYLVERLGAEKFRRSASKLKIGGHQWIKVIEEEAFLNYMTGDEQFEKAKSLRMNEIKTNRKTYPKLPHEEMLAKKTRKTELGSLIKKGKASYLEASEHKSLHETLQQHRYLDRVEGIYQRAPEEAEAQMRRIYSRKTFEEVAEEGADTFRLRRGLGGDIDGLAEQLKRQNRFSLISKEAGGAGNRAAFNAGKKHCRFATRNLPKLPMRGIVGAGLIGVAATGVAAYLFNQ